MGPAPAMGWPPTPWPCRRRGEESGRDLPVSSAQDKEQLRPAPEGILAQPRGRLPPKPELPHQLATMSGRGVSAKGLAQSPESLLLGDAGPLAPLGAPLFSLWRPGGPGRGCLYGASAQSCPFIFGLEVWFCRPASN